MIQITQAAVSLSLGVGDVSITQCSTTKCRMLLRNEAHLSSKSAIDALRKLSSILHSLE